MPTYLLITIPLPLYDGFLEKLDMSSRAYEIMMAASLERTRSDDHFTRAMKILCRADEAELLLDHANRLYPDAAPDITRAIRSAGA